MYKYTVTAEAPDLERTQIFQVIAPNVDRAWARAYYECNSISANSGNYWTPTDVSKTKEDQDEN